MIPRTGLCGWRRATGVTTATVEPPSQFVINISLMSRVITRMEGEAGKH
ncbi:MAG: hypothetical protein ABSB94_17450 [Syntrophorhabdales bacterium]